MTDHRDAITGQYVTAEHAAIMRVSLAINAATTNGCMPQLYVEAAEKADRD